MNRHPSLYGLGGGWAQGIVRGGVALAFAGESDCVFGDGALAGVVQSVAGEGYVAAILSGYAPMVPLRNWLPVMLMRLH